MQVEITSGLLLLFVHTLWYFYRNDLTQGGENVFCLFLAYQESFYQTHKMGI